MNVRGPMERIDSGGKTIEESWVEGMKRMLMHRTVDPWFNFRATKYLVNNGFYKFWDWFDDRKLEQPTYLGTKS